MSVSGMPTPTIVALGERGDAPRDDSDAGRRRRLRTRIVVAAAVALLLLASVLLMLLRPASVDGTFDPTSAEDDGARATAQVLREQGVDVSIVRTTAGAIAEAEAGSTLLIVGPGDLRREQLEALSRVGADIVLTDLGSGQFTALTPRLTMGGFVSTTTYDADCADTNAQAAGTILAGGRTITGGVTTCFDGLYATWTDDQGRTWRAISDARILTNEYLATEGNAALVFHSLGATERLVWYMPSLDDDFGIDETVPLLPIPGPLVLQLLVVGGALVLLHGRRLGRVVVEPLPVVVKASETTRGRARLYRRARAHAHAAGALRAGLVARLAPRIGLPSHAQPSIVVDTLARASGRDPAAVGDVLYGPPPTTDEGLAALTQALDTLESEVQRG